MAVPVEPIGEENPFLTGTDLAPATSLSQKLGLSPGSRYEVEHDHVGEDMSEGSQSSEDVSDEPREVDESTREEMAKLDETFRERGMKFRMIDRVGEGMAKKMPLCEAADCLHCLGTFSTVYKAEDLHYEYYQSDWDVESKCSTKWTSPPFKRRRDDTSQSFTSDSSQNRRRRRPSRFVAIKKIYVTSSPMRIQNELELLHDLRGCKAVCPLITAFRHQDQVVAILPHFRHQDFRVRDPALWYVLIADTA